MNIRRFPDFLNDIFCGIKDKVGIKIPREVEGEIADYFEGCSLGRCVSPSEDYSADKAMEDYINFIYCALLLQYISSINIEIYEFMEELNKFKTCVGSKIQRSCSDLHLPRKIREFDTEYLPDYKNLAEESYKKHHCSSKNIMREHNELRRKLIGECEVDIPFRENSTKNKRAAVGYLWRLFSALRTAKISQDSIGENVPHQQHPL
ncbi:hypothetical protein PM10SUCC1_07060 [Propionigenium maris DSM 9537]|uniref:Uncharacterized protein n=1 Tax=Propionigenium maris DSM 9537 TaxID=1123000 RepID=A0A9W6GK23_9FUSO|nr:hypothetical protein [Propionigenium maris]GLI55191.1 hypothetical protein PM10SUCC1_07060 [Propionigenium maris DSM 9537]